MHNKICTKTRQEEHTCQQKDVNKWICLLFFDNQAIKDYNMIQIPVLADFHRFETPDSRMAWILEDFYHGLNK